MNYIDKTQLIDEKGKHKKYNNYESLSHVFASLDFMAFPFTSVRQSNLVLTPASWLASATHWAKNPKNVQKCQILAILKNATHDTKSLKKL